MNKQLREDLGKILIQYETAKWLSMETGAYVANEDMLDELESYINDNYVSKETIKKEYMHVSKLNWSKFPPELKDDVPTPESEKNL